MRYRQVLRIAARLSVVVCLSRTSAAEVPNESPWLDSSGEPFVLSSLLGQVVVLDFWAPWCVPCRKSFPFLERLRAAHETEGLRVVGVTLDDDEEAIRAFVESVPVGFPVVRDPSETAGERFAVAVMPTTFLLDRQGRVAARFEGGDAKVHAKIEAAVGALLAGRPLPEGSDVRVASSQRATGDLKAWRRGILADPIMNLDGDPLTRLLREHIHASKEGSAGDGGAAGGGCGCN